MSNEAQITQALEKVKIDLVKSYRDKGLKASGNWEKELEIFYRETGNGFNFGILGASYTEQLQGGRLKNAKQDDKSLKAWVGWAGSTFLKQWVQDKGLNISPFAVAWKIAREGIKVPNRFNKGGLVSDVINDKMVQAFIDIIRVDKIENVKSDVRNILK